jgi:exodeoxyribonuclease VII large subunit
MFLTQQLFSKMLWNSIQGRKVNHVTYLSLFEFNTLIKEVIGRTFFEAYWIVAEIARFSRSATGHCYLELIDREADGRTAKGSAVIWAGLYRSVTARFEKETGLVLTEGIKIMMLAEVDFHQEYGLKLIIRDIDPAYTLGEMAMKKKEILRRLAQEGLIDRNKFLHMPAVPQRIAVISSQSAAGFQDFIHQLESTPYTFTCHLYKSLMQGSKIEESMSKALEKLKQRINDYDVIVIVRGGGGRADLHSFDNYTLAKTIASLPIPVISGIGHERDTSVIDEVAHTRVKTPTAAAEFLIERVRDFDNFLNESITFIMTTAERVIEREKTALAHTLQNLALRNNDAIAREMNTLTAYGERIKRAQTIPSDKLMSLMQHTEKLKEKLLQLFKKEHDWIRSKTDNLRHLDPRQVLKRGYSLTRNSNGKLIKDIESVHKGECIETIIFQGTIISEVNETIKTVR